MALLDPDAAPRADAAADALGAPEEVSGAGSVAGFLRRARGAKAAIDEGEPALVWAPGGRLRVILRLSAAGRSGKVTRIDAVAEPSGRERLAPVVTDL